MFYTSKITEFIYTNLINIGKQKSQSIFFKKITIGIFVPHLICNQSLQVLTKLHKHLKWWHPAP